MTAQPEGGGTPPSERTQSGFGSECTAFGFPVVFKRRCRKQTKTYKTTWFCFGFFTKHWRVDQKAVKRKRVLEFVRKPDVSDVLRGIFSVWGKISALTWLRSER